MAPSGESFRNTFFFLRMVQPFYRWYLQNTTNNVTGTQEDHDRSRYAAYSVKYVYRIYLDVLKKPRMKLLQLYFNVNGSVNLTV